MAEDFSRRREDRPTYTEADMARMRREVQDEMRVTQLAGEMGELRGLVAKVPADMELVARRVFGEQWAQLRKESTATRWRGADTVIAAGQFLIAAAVFVVAVFK